MPGWALALKEFMNDTDSTYIKVYSLILWTIAVVFASHEFFEMYGRDEIEKEVLAKHDYKLQNCQRVILGGVYE